MSEKTAVLLLQMGGPDSLDAIEPFLLQPLFRPGHHPDRAGFSAAVHRPLHCRAAAPRKCMEYYRKIGGKSPMRELTEQQAASWKQVLGTDYRCFVAMRYWKPYHRLRRWPPSRAKGSPRVIALSLYPHYSRATSVPASMNWSAG